MTYCPAICFNNICNNYLDLSDFELTQEQFDKVMYCLINPQKVPFELRAQVLDLEDSILIKTNGDRIKITRNLIPPELDDSKIYFWFGYS